MLTNRPPIVVILGHVDHGKTTLLDYIRKSNVAAREAGGITQHIRSFQLPTTGDKLLTFIDTPGHEAFTAMRSRGSQLADIALLVIAANDGVMPQTKQSIEFIRAANIPFIVVLNKSDMNTADPIRVKTQLTEMEVVVEDFGGDVPAVSVSAKTGQGIPELIELIQLVAEMNPPQADPQAEVQAVVLESRLDAHKGSLATVIIKEGTLTLGQNLFQQASVGKVRAILGSDGSQLKQAPPSLPVEIIGLSIVPAVGSVISSVPFVAPTVAAIQPKGDMPVSEARLVIKADVAGSLEAILAALPREITVMAASTGDVTEGDVDLAKTSGGKVFTFNVKTGSSVAKLAEVEHVTIKSFKIIYELLDESQKLLTPKIIEKILGKAIIAAEFKMNGDHVAGCRCTEGVISRGDQLKIMRGEQQIGLTKFKSLQSGKNLVDKVKSGAEFGAVFNTGVDFKLQDSIIAIEYES